MNCPSCQAQIADDAVVCDHCLTVIDVGFLGDGITNEADTPKPAPTPAPKAAPMPKPAPAPARATPSPTPRPAPAQTDGGTRMTAAPQRPPPQTDGGTRMVAAPTASTGSSSAAPPKRAKEEITNPRGAAPKPPAARPPAPEREKPVRERDSERPSLAALAAVPSSVNESIYELGEQIKAFPPGERILTIAAALFLVSLGFPWRWTKADDDLIGFMSGAWPMGLLAVTIGVAAFVRRTPKVRPFKIYVIMGVFCLSALLALCCLMYVFNSIDMQTMHQATHLRHEAQVRPGLGAGVGLIAAVTMFSASVVCLLNRERLPDA